MVPTMSKHMHEHRELAHEVVKEEDRGTRKFFVTLPRYNLNEPEGSFALVGLFAGRKKTKRV